MEYFFFSLCIFTYIHAYLRFYIHTCFHLPYDLFSIWYYRLSNIQFSVLYIPSLYYSFWDLLLSFWCFTWNMRIYFYFGVWNLLFSILSIHLSRFSCIFIIFSKKSHCKFLFLMFHVKHYVIILFHLNYVAY